IFKARYFSGSGFLDLSKGLALSFIWKSIHKTKEVLLKVTRWRIGKWSLMSIFNDPWINDDGNFFVDITPLDGCEHMRVDSPWQSLWNQVLPQKIKDIFGDCCMALSLISKTSLHGSVNDFVALMQDDKRRHVLGMLMGIWFSRNMMIWKHNSMLADRLVHYVDKFLQCWKGARMVHSSQAIFVNSGHMGWAVVVHNDAGGFVRCISGFMKSNSIPFMVEILAIH
ncbi:hypothetical protein Goarm_010295, partial [Gossypium armourianum]|nr:hypothetical protein [Gossypium armourianum]